ncbi:Afadin/alpha-actinin-binding [Penicillium bovifimosum]|uniref:Afadin/alpha-actinin-binding n=1 Tax=Penicillium bovifimosum TaxID=126998 RepID=A0A9W9KVN5_9EURO|nr:Afadin/alpha-actinin-binding [Penicillium bovifimosum]KAJ5121100.1 Afadin/alpha-actinin-binding [Penicillium bovifimosum]
MESHNLQAASTYVNNILLARGLLKGGRAIDFADPENEDGGIDGTMARVINLVNDLVLRRDREAEHRESLSTTIRTLQASEAEQTTEIGKLKTKTSELTRSLALAEAQERTLKSNVSSAEASIRSFKEQIQRMKSTVQQVRAQCANDIRKRDLEMQKLKSHLAERQRGRREGLTVTTININPASDRSRLLASGGERVHDPGYSLKQETTEFLTELCQNLSDENDTLIELARKTIHTLKDLQGLPQAEHENGENQQSTMGVSMGALKSSSGPVTSLPTSCEELSTHMEAVLDHLRTLLTNPSFVPLEEVEVRDEEIKRLRDGWVKMESRWKQAVTMMSGWQRRLADGGDSVQADELKRGMKLDLSINSPEGSSMQSVPEADPIPTILEDQAEEQDTSESEDKAPATMSNPKTRSKLRKVPDRPDRALRERSENAMTKRPRKVSFTPGLQGSPCVETTDEEPLQIKAYKAETVSRRPSRRKTETPGTHQLNAKESLSVHQKLAAVEDEAREAQSELKARESRKKKPTREGCQAEQTSEYSHHGRARGADAHGPVKDQLIPTNLYCVDMNLIMDLFILFFGDKVNLGNFVFGFSAPDATLSLFGMIDH